MCVNRATKIYDSYVSRENTIIYRTFIHGLF